MSESTRFRKNQIFLVQYVFSRAELVDIWSNNNRSGDAVQQHILESIAQKHLNNENIKSINEKVKAFVNYINKHLPKCNSTLERFKGKHSKWLAKSIFIEITGHYALANKVGRPKCDYESAGPRLKRKLAAELSEENNNLSPLLIHAATVSAKKSNEKDLAVVLKAAGSCESINEIKKKLFADEPKQMSADSALAFLLENGFTKSQYINIQRNAKIHGCDIYPAYPAVLNSKLKLRPKGIEYFENKAHVSLQNLLDHTSSRILEMQHEVLETLPNVVHCKLFFSYGYDGSSGQSLYKQGFQIHDSPSIDSSLFVTTIVPLKLINETQQIIWLNKTPQSVRFCRPLKIEFIKETTALILAEKENLDAQIRNMQIYLYKFKEKYIYVEYTGHMTLIDGKVLNILSGTNSCQSCPICGAKPKQLLDIKDINSKVFTAKAHALQYGISPLHAWIRFFEFVLKISYRIELKKWHVKDCDKLKLKARKRLLQLKMMKEMGLNVDKPLSNGSGNSNDGNTARRAFSNAALLSSILDFDYDILQSFHTILTTINCEYDINSEKFKAFCAKVFVAYHKKYPWYPMSPTVHKVLVHGHQIIDTCLVPVGCLGEHASESRNKLYKSDRRGHARKCSRLDNITDVFNRSMDSSDPLLSSTYLKQRANTIKKPLTSRSYISITSTTFRNSMRK